MNLTPIFSVNDVNQAAINTQEIYNGDDFVSDDNEAVYFILLIDGTDVTIKDLDDNTKGIFTDKVFLHPLRMNFGFKASAGADFTMIYCKLKI